ncbi:MAG: hypothetical protein ABSF26_17415 [Thermoguttaceae bacterium]
MITITRRLASSLRAVFRRVLGTARAAGPALCFTTSPEGMRVSLLAKGCDAAVEYHSPGKFPHEQLWVPLDLLADCEGKRNDPVELEQAAKGRVLAGWTDGIPQRIQYHIPEPWKAEEFPVRPEHFAQNPPDLPVALDFAAATTDPDAVRYALGCIRLSGKSGQLAATDGRQIYLHGGFSFPWEEELLVPRSTVFGCRELPQDQPVGIGRAGEWVAFAVGPWTIYLRINKDGRFPDIDRHIPCADAAMARCQFSASDAEFLLNTLPKLPCDEDSNTWPVTVELNGALVVRAKMSTQTEPTELLLSHASIQGGPARVNTNRKYLGRALKLGFRELAIFNPQSPILCQDDRRIYLWAPLEPDSAIGPTENAVRIHVPEGAAESHPKPEPKRNVSTMTEPIENLNPEPQTTEAKTNGQARKPSRKKAAKNATVTLVEQAEELRNALRDALTKTTTLIQAIKENQRRGRALRNTLASLKQLQAVDA